MATLHDTPWLLQDDPVESIFKGAQIGSQIYRNQQDNRERKATEAYRQAQMAKILEEQRIAAAEEARMFAGRQEYEIEVVNRKKLQPNRNPQEIQSEVFSELAHKILPGGALGPFHQNLNTQSVREKAIEAKYLSEGKTRDDKFLMFQQKQDELGARLNDVLTSREGVAANRVASAEGIAARELAVRAEQGSERLKQVEAKNAKLPEVLALKAALYAIYMEPGLTGENREEKRNKLLADFAKFEETGERPKALTAEQVEAKKALGKLQEDRLKLMQKILSGDKKAGPDVKWNWLETHQEKLAEIDKNMAEANKILQGSDAALVAAPVAPSGLLGDILGTGTNAVPVLPDESSIPLGDRAPTARDSSFIPASPEDIFGPPDAVPAAPVVVKQPKVERVIVEKDGKKFSLPVSQLEEAKKKGYKPAK